MSDDSQDGMTLRQEVEADLTEDLSQRLHKLIDARTDLGLFRERLIHILTRYETYEIRKPKVTRKARKSQIENLKDKAEKFLAAASALHPQTEQSIDHSIGSEKLRAHWHKFGVLNLDAPDVSESDGMSDCTNAVSEVIAACDDELRQLDETKGEGRKSSNPEVDQLISDLADIYATESQLGKSPIYPSETSEDGYEGGLYLLTKVLLQEYAPTNYASCADGLGQRIRRVLSTL
ncbi:hypothetical protein [Celeribacter baekdonensis]|uniref:Uncharacterized protein n=1 Tax=Celeribacter baekdonensis B30 TaxID=1208323 RepID=K2K782_9RHOB|nr:hypothetical protein [Celeribacter baekdonensis]EKE73255.1 hypothetical protein B30_04312 [Celeribacter baekdonensis B30]|tara:strand:+ start:10834 stop:11535 length:702 start_codon:yes stop_codon:yes gene_type:complete